MTGVATEECEAGRSIGGVSNPPGEESAELRSLGQVENGIPSTSPSYWDSDNEDGGPKPSDLYGKYTWKIDKFSQINKRELRSSVFEIGGYKWYILIYPQGCDVCNHISLFLCVANHDKLLPGWSHFAQFTIAVVNKDSKKSKYSDTLHRFWKKEHDWGWKKFMELSKVLDGFIDDDTLTIKAQVQVIRERQDRPFRCLDFQYRRELVRVYLTNVDQICRRTVEDWRCKLRKLIEDKARWSSFCAFWLGMDPNLRSHMSREKAECVLKLVVKKFFIDKEVTSTLVMDSVYSGLKALEGQKKGKKCKGKYPDMEQTPNPLIYIEIDMFVLVDDLLFLIERAAMEPLPPKDEKGPQDRMKDGAAGDESIKDSIERDERKLTELGCRTIEIFTLYHIYSKIEVAYQEVVALKRQEELIREEEAACFAEIDQKARRGLSDKEKKSKKKQAKQKKIKIKVKDNGRDEKHFSIAKHKIEQDSPTVDGEDFAAVETKMVLEPSDVLEDASDVSDSVDCVVSEGKVENSANWGTDICESRPSSSGISALSGLVNGKEGRSPSTVDDSSSTCLSDSVVPSIVANVPNRGDSAGHQINQRSLSGGRNNQITANRVREETVQQSEAVAVQSSDASQSSRITESLSRLDLQDRMVNGSARHSGKKVEEAVSSTKRNFDPKDDFHVDLSRGRSTCISPPKSPWKSVRSIKIDPPPVKVKSSSSFDSTKQGGRLISVENSARMQTGSQKLSIPRPTEKASMQPQMKFTSRPSSAPLVVPVAQAGPSLARSASTVGRRSPVHETTSYAHPQQSYLNAIMGAHVNHHSLNVPYSSQAPTTTLVSAPLFSPIQPSFSFGMVSQQHETLQNGHLWMEEQRSSRNFLDAMQQRRDLYTNGNPVQNSRLQSGHQAHVTSAAPTDEFPHLDIINDLLNDDIINDYRNFSYGPQHRAQAYHDGFQEHDYVTVNPSRIPYDAAHGPYVNWQSDVFVPNQWQMSSASESSILGLGNTTTDNVDGYLYHQPRVPEYPNLNVGFNSHTVFRPSDGR